MTNQTVIFIYALLALINASLLISSIFNGKKQHAVKQFIFICWVIFCWQINEIVYFIVSDPVWLVRLYNSKIVFVAFAPVALLIFIMRFYRLDDMLTKQFVIGISIMPSLTSIIALTSEFHTLLREKLTIIATAPLHIVDNIRGTWFWVHSVYSYLIMICVCIMIIYFFRKMPRMQRLPSTLLLLGIAATLFSNIIIILKVIDTPFDFTLIGMSVALMFVFTAMANSESADFLILARNDVFNYLEDYVFILDKKRNILDANPAGWLWIATLGIKKIENISFNDVLAFLNNGQSDVGFGELDRENLNTYITNTQNPVVLSLREREVKNNDGVTLGLFATFTDVTHYRMLIDRLVETAGIDPLTGLANRRTFEYDKKNLDTVENLPLSIILGDVNGLKQVNDSLGHKYGDNLLRTIAQVLEANCLRGGVVSRIGGDEFVLLLPNTPSQAAKKIVDNIILDFSAIKIDENVLSLPSMAMGIATKNTPDQDINALIQQADIAMYSNKNTDRRGRWRGGYENRRDTSAIEGNPKED